YLQLHETTGNSSNIAFVVVEADSSGAFGIFEFGIGVNASVAHAALDITKSRKELEKLQAFNGRGTPPTKTVLRASNGKFGLTTKFASDKTQGRS
uniref:Enolase n=1 Tax=Romanomermis culicivorax TaxID=13658 RepID=A0A915HE99_ROMCU